MPSPSSTDLFIHPTHFKEQQLFANQPRLVAHHINTRGLKYLGPEGTPPKSLPFSDLPTGLQYDTDFFAALATPDGSMIVFSD